MAGDIGVRVASLEELKPGVPHKITVDGKDAMLIRDGTTIHACGSKCTHYGGPLNEGHRRGNVMACPWHTARFDLTSGTMVAAPALDDEPFYRVTVRGDDVYIRSVPALRVNPRLTDPRQVVIVGAGASGNAAAEMLRREGFDGRIIMITAEPDLPYDRTRLSKSVLSGEAEIKSLPLRDANFYHDRAIEVLAKHRVERIDPGQRHVTLAGGRRIEFDFALLATGGRPRPLNVPGAQLANIFTLRSLADGDRILSALEKAGKVVVIGSGFIGIEAASSIRKRGLEVDVVSLENTPMERVFGERIGRQIQAMHETDGIRFHLGQTVKEFTGARKVETVHLTNAMTLPADVVLVALGIDPVVDYLEGSGLVQDGAVPVDSHLRTKAPAIFAAGDIALVPIPRFGGRERVEHWIVAERQGQHVARVICGKAAEYDEPPFFWTNQHGVSIKYVGHPSTFDQIAYRGEVTAKKFCAGYFDQGRLVAAAGLAKMNQIFAVDDLLRTGEQISFDQFADESFDLVEHGRQAVERRVSAGTPRPESARQT